MTEKPQPLPSSGGSYTLNDKGELIPARPEPEAPPRKPAVKEG
ncbi:MAG: hypothetical protein ACOY4T_11830 [Pseudomonadota bacterium]